jgi:pimeloyl-ACP methyl ester carboxylesterase
MQQRDLMRANKRPAFAGGPLHSWIMVLAASLLCSQVFAQAPTHVEGTLENGAAYMFDLPPKWNGTLLLFSRGYSPGPKLTAANSMGPNSKQWLLAKGYALAGSSFSKGGWSVAEAIPDNLATLDVFIKQFGKPKRTIAWGASMGALITVAMVERHPDRFDAGLPMCGSLAGAVGMLNLGLDGAFAIKTLLAPQNADLMIVGATDDMATVKQAMAVVSEVQSSAAGRARLALAATLAQVPTWVSDGSPEPGHLDYEAQGRNQAATMAMSTFYPRSDAERRAGGNFSWNTGVDYTTQLARSGRREYVAALYKAAGVDLDADLAKLNAAPRISADPQAVEYMMQNYAPSGDLTRPVLALHTIGDGMTTPMMESAYREYVHTSGKDSFFRSSFTRRAGHCQFTAAEQIAALQTLEERIDGGTWNATPEALNRRASALGLDGQIDYAGGRKGADAISAKPSALFVSFEPAAFLRACGSGKNVCEGRPVAHKG